MAKLREAIDKMPGAEKAKPRKAINRPYGFVLEVDLKYFGIGERPRTPRMPSSRRGRRTRRHHARRQATRHFARQPSQGTQRMGLARDARWPVGHIRITLRTLASDLDLQRDKLDTIAVRVRDRIPDRPFAMVGYSRSEERDPCTLITRQEAESVLGPLLIPPYRTGRRPLAYATGPNCGYYTAGHHVVIVTRIGRVERPRSRRTTRSAD
jgi:hypothetical protein